MAIPWSINTGTKTLLIPDPSVNQRSTLGSVFYLAYISLVLWVSILYIVLTIGTSKGSYPVLM
jgi:hypothetical protein